MKKWPLLPVPLYPQPGLIVAHPAATGSGHCGIVDYDGVGIAAGVNDVNKLYLYWFDGTSGWRTYVQ